MRDATFADARDRVLPHIDDTHALVGVAPEGDPSLRYQIVVPKGWSRARAVGQVGGTARAPQVLGLFAEDRDDLRGPRVVVTVERLRFEVPARQLVTERWEQAGWKIGVSRPVDNGRFEVGGLRDMGSHVEVRRTTGFVDGARLIRIDAAAPLPAWSRVHDLVWPCGPLMLLQRPTHRAAVEPRRRYAASGLELRLPQSWSASWVADAPELVATTSVADDATVVTRLHADTEALAGECREALSRYGVGMSRVGALVRPHDLDAADAVISRYDCTVPQGHPPREIYIGTRRVQEHDVGYLAVASRRPCWARYRTIRALQVAMETTQVAA